jgi:hypothetical protein
MTRRIYRRLSSNGDDAGGFRCRLERGINRRRRDGSRGEVINGMMLRRLMSVLRHNFGLV